MLHSFEGKTIRSIEWSTGWPYTQEATSIEIWFTDGSYLELEVDSVDYVERDSWGGTRENVQPYITQNGDSEPNPHQVAYWKQRDA